MYLLWSWIVPNSHKIPKGTALLEKHKACLDPPSLESLVLHVWGGFPLPWEPGVSAEEWDKYLKKRYQPKGIRLPRSVESAIRGAIANDYLASKKVEDFTRYCNDIADDEGERSSIVEHVKAAITEKKPVDISFIFGLQRMAKIE